MKNTPAMLLPLSKEAQVLADMALASQHSSSFYEDMSWYRTLHQQLQISLKNSVKVVDEVLDFLQEKGEMIAYDRFFTMVEATSVYTQIQHKGKTYDGLSMVIPISVWTRFQVPKPTATASDIAALAKILRRVVLTEEAQVYIYPQWMRCVEMDTSFFGIHRQTQQLVEAALDPKAAEKVDVRPPLGRLFPQYQRADSMVLLVGVAVPAGQEIFRWQRGPAPLCLRRDDILQSWQRQVSKVLKGQFEACHIEALLPDTFYVAMSNAHKQIQVGLLSWHVQCLQDRFPSASLSDVVATVALCRYNNQYEIRIGLSHHAKNEQPDEGMIWPLHMSEQSLDFELMDLTESAPLLTVAKVLDRLGVKQVNICRRVVRIFDGDEEENRDFPNPKGRLAPIVDSEESTIGEHFQ